MSAINTKAIVNSLCDLCKHEGLRATVKGSAKGAVIVGSCALLGGLLGGPIGLGVGKVHLFFECNFYNKLLL